MNVFRMGRSLYVVTATIFLARSTANGQVVEPLFVNGSFEQGTGGNVRLSRPPLS